VIRLFAFILGLTMGLVGAQTQAADPGGTIRDCPQCPELVVVPPGKFTMGDSSPGVFGDEKPAHQVAIAKPFALGKFEVTFDEWDACVADGGCTFKPSDHGWGRGKRPVIGISWEEIQPYLTWLSKKTGKTYRLPTEAEWEYAARAGTTTPYAWGAEIGQGMANCAKCGSEWDNKETAPVGSFKPNAFGLYDMEGNVTEWVGGCYTYGYENAPKDGSAFQPRAECNERTVRGGSWHDDPPSLRVSARQWYYPLNGFTFMGLRVARSME
jgi:formylglycine-generating enzyme required for sulfatase activity